MRHTPQIASLMISFITVTSLFLTVTQCLPYNDGTMTANNYFSYAGKYSINPNDLTLGNPSQYTIPYPNNYYWYYTYCVVSFGDLIMQAANYSMDAILEATICYSISLSISVRTGNLNSISKLSVSHFSHDDWRLYGNPFRYYSSSMNRSISKDPSTTAIVQVNYDYLSYFYFQNYKYYSYTNSHLRAIVFLNGFKVSSNSSSITYSVSLTVELLPSNGDSKTVKVYVGSLSQVPTYVQAIAFTVFIHQSPNSGNQYDRNVRIYSQSFGGSNSFQYSNDKHIMESFNTFLGLNSFLASNQSQLSFQSLIVDKSAISMISPNYLSVTYIIVYSKWCQYNQPYYFGHYGEDNCVRCFESCPSCTYSDNYNYYCYYKNLSLRQKCLSQIQTEYLFLHTNYSWKQSIFISFLIVFTIFAAIGYFLLKKSKQRSNNSSQSTQKKNIDSQLQNDKCQAANTTEVELEPGNQNFIQYQIASKLETLIH